MQKPERSEVLRLIYRGRFLHQATTLSCEPYYMFRYSGLYVHISIYMSISLHFSPSLLPSSHSPFFLSPLALSLPLGKTTVMHMIVRDKIPEEQNTGMSPSLCVYKTLCSLRCTKLFFSIRIKTREDKGDSRRSGPQFLLCDIVNPLITFCFWCVHYLNSLYH